MIRALELVDSLDVTALQGFTQDHPSGLKLLSAAAEGLVLPEDVHEERIAKLFSVLDEAFEELVVDLPRRIDRATAAVLDRSDSLMLVVQQTVAHLQEVKRLGHLLMGELGIGPERLVVIINRFQRHGEVRLEDFRDALPGVGLQTLPNDYRSASESINLGVPLLEHAPRGALTKALAGLVDSVISPDATSVTRARRGTWSWISQSRH